MSVLEELVKITTKHPIITILVVLAITGFALVSASNFAVDTSIEGWFKEDDPDIKMAEEIKEQFGAQDLVTVVVDSANSDAPTAESYVELLAGKLKKDNRWKNIQYKRDINFAGEKAILYLPEEQLMALADPNIKPGMIKNLRASMLEGMDASKYIVSDNGEVCLINMGINIEMTNPKERESLFDNLGILIEETQKEDGNYKNLEVGFTGGMMVIDYEGDKMAMRDFYITAIITFTLILILLFFSFRSLSIPLLSLIPLLIGIIWASGAIFLIYDSLSMMSIMFAVLIMGLGVDYCIHLLARFMNEMDEHNDIILSFKHTFVHTGKAVILGCVTTAAAFFAYYFTELKVLHQLGVIGAIGLILTITAVFVLLPALVVLRLKFGRFNRRRSEFNILGKIGLGAQRFAPIILVLLVALCVVFGVKARDAELNRNMYDLFPTELETWKQLEKVKDSFDYNPDYLISTAESESELSRLTKEFQDIDEVLKTESILDYFPQGQDEKLSIIKRAIEVHPEFAAVPWINVEPIKYNELPLHIQQEWVSDKENFLIKIIPKGDLYEKPYQEELLSDLREANSNVTSDAVLWTKIFDMMADDILRASLMASGALLIIVYVGIRRRNPIYALLSFVPVGFGILGLMGTYQWFGANLNAFSIIMIPLIIGIGIDDGIHIIHRYLEEGKGSIPKVVQLTGKAIFLTTATTCLAFSSFLFSSHPSMKFLALVPIIGISMCFFGAIIFLPALLRIFVDKRKDNKENFKG